MTLKELEANAILTALEMFGGNKSKAARYLGVCIKTIRNKVNKNPGLKSFMGVPRRYVNLLKSYSTYEDALHAVQLSMLWRFSTKAEKETITKYIQKLYEPRIYRDAKES